MSRLFPFVLAFLLLAVLAVSLIVAPAKAAPQSTEQVFYEILHERGSPLAEESYTLVAFRRYHGPDFNMINFLALTWAESNLGRDRYVRRHHNVSSIKGGPVGTLWRDLRTGTFGGGFNRYRTARDGQRAALRLVMRYYGGDVVRNDGLHKWYGRGVAGWYSYKRNFDAARRILVHEGHEHGLNPVHLR